MHIALIGATGLVGSQLMEKLVHNQKIQKVTTISRRPLKTTPGKVNQLILAKMNADHIRKMSVKADIFICALGTTIKAAGSKEQFKEVDYELVVAFAQLAKKENAKAFFVISAMGANKNSKIFYNQVKGEMEKTVLAQELPATYILQPSLIIGDRSEKRPGEAVGIGVYRLLAPALPQKVKRYLGSEVPHIVNYIEKSLFDIQPGTHRISDFN